MYRERRAMIRRPSQIRRTLPLAKLANNYREFLLVTQNVDNLHARAADLGSAPCANLDLPRGRARLSTFWVNEQKLTIIVSEFANGSVRPDLARPPESSHVVRDTMPNELGVTFERFRRR